MIPEVEAARWHKAIMYQVHLFWQKFRESPHILMSHDLYEMLYRDDHYRDSFRCAAAEYDELRASAIVEVFLSTGCRVGEMEKMQRHEVNWNDGSMIVHGKGNKDRVVFLNDKARFFLERYLKSRDDDTPNLFVSLHSPHDGLGKSSIEKIIREIGTECGVKAHPHKFRRTCATNALRHGMPIDQVARMLGHNSIETTKIYLDTDDEDLKYAHKRYVLG